MDVQEIVKSRLRPYLRNECEMIQLRDEYGMSLRPSRIYPICGAFGTDWGRVDLVALDRERSKGLLDWLKRLRSEYPEIATEFASTLNKAEQVWNGCLAA